jgi:hypothetical protein
VSAGTMSCGAVRPDAVGVFGLELPPRHFEVVMGPKIEPEDRAVAEVQAQPKCGVGPDAPLVIDDLGDTVWRDANGLGEPMLGQAVRDQELFFSAFRRE